MTRKGRADLMEENKIKKTLKKGFGGMLNGGNGYLRTSRWMKTPLTLPTRRARIKLRLSC